MRIQEFIEKLAGVKMSGDGFLAICPAHNDRNPSLSVSEKDERILLYCHAGCTTAAIVAAMGVRTSDLFSSPRETREIAATYSYTDESGRVLFEVVRYAPKAFRQRRPDGMGNWIWSLKNTRRVLYRLPDLVEAAQVLVLEGEKDVETARRLGFSATCNPGGAGKWSEEYSEALRGKEVVVIADADEPGRNHAQQVAQSLNGKATSTRLLELPGAKDLSEWVECGGKSDQFLNLLRSCPPWPPAALQNPPTPRLRAVTAAELLKLDLKPREMILHPFLPSQGLAMLYSKRGVGKTYISLGIAVAVASGGAFLAWKAPIARQVLYLDGEMPCSALQQRLCSIIAGSMTSPEDENLRIITPDLQDCGLPDLASPYGQQLIEGHLDGVSLLVLDNLSALVRAGKENEGEGWLPVQEWALGLRRRGISVLFDHHAGKSGAQRGTSRREDLLDSVITLKHPSDYSPSEGLRCEVHYEKTRGFFGEDAKLFEVRMHPGERGEAIWTVSNFETGVEKRVAELLALGMSVRDVEEETGVSKSKVSAPEARDGIRIVSRHSVPISVPRGSLKMGQNVQIDIKSLAFMLLERLRTVPRPVPHRTTDGTVDKPSTEVGSCLSREFSAWSSEQTLYANRFGQSHALLFPLVGKRVSTPRGPGRLETVYAKRCEVVLDSEPKMIAVFPPCDIGAAI